MTTKAPPQAENREPVYYDVVAEWNGNDWVRLFDADYNFVRGYGGVSIGTHRIIGKLRAKGLRLLPRSKLANGRP